MRIKLVDDDTSVIQSLLATIKTLPGHEIRAATTGEKALENAATLGGLDLLIADVVMEPMDGFVLRDQMMARYPKLRTILMSGYDLSEYAEQMDGIPFLQKPFEPAAVLAAVEKELAPPPAPVPVAAPRPVAVARPAAVPRVAAAAPKVAAAPVAQPRAVAVPPPTAVARAAAPAPAAPQARPVARPAAVAQPTAVPRPAVAQPVASPRPAVVPQAKAASPQAAPVARPVAVPGPRAVPPVSPGPLAVPVASPSVPGLVTKPGEFTGQTIGAYEVMNQMGEDEWGAVYAAVQTAINRPVSLHVLSAERATDEASRLRFIADARAKAQVQHPSILAVYEAGDSDGRIFYANEYVDGQNLAQLAAGGQKINERTAMNILRTAADGLAYLEANNIPHLPVDGSSVQLGTDGQARLVNLATQLPDQQISAQDEITALGRAMFAIVHTGPGFSPGLRGLLGRMVQSATSGLSDWAQVGEGVTSIEPKNVPSAAAAIGAQDRAAAAALEAARLQQKKELRRNVISMVSFVVLAGLIVWYVMRNRAHVVEEWVAIPAGSYTVGQKQVTLPKFSISKYEVTIGQYAAFLDYLETHPGNSKDFDHDRQPKYLDHRPEHWAIYYGQAKNGGAVAGAPYSLDSPMVMVTWWDAYAYAKWRGQQLPTEDQWEAAARGPTGLLYPWGNDRDDKKVNSGADYVTPTSAKGKVDGWNWWSPVDGVRGDKSPLGVVGMAGNVSEWVDTWTEDKRFPIVKGGNYMSADVRLDKRVDNQDGSKGADHIGFRTVTSN